MTTTAPPATSRPAARGSRPTRALLLHAYWQAAASNEKTALIGFRTEDAASFLAKQRGNGEFEQGSSVTEHALDAMSFFVADVQHMGALTAIYCHSEDKGLGLNFTETGIIMAVQYAVSVMFAPICGHILDHTTKKRMFLCGALLATASSYRESCCATGAALPAVPEHMPGGAAARAAAAATAATLR